MSLRPIIIFISLISMGLTMTAYGFGDSHNHYPVPPIPIVKTTHSAYIPMPTHDGKSVVAMVYPGSLKANITRIIKQHGWHKVVWTLPYDYNFVSSVRIRAGSVQAILSELLENYPLQAVFYKGNRVVLIKSRALS